MKIHYFESFFGSMEICQYYWANLNDVSFYMNREIEYTDEFKVCIWRIKLKS